MTTKGHPGIYLLAAVYAALSGCASIYYATSIEPGSDWSIEQVCGGESCGGGPVGALHLPLGEYRVQILPEVSHDPATGQLWYFADVRLVVYPNPSGSIQFVPAFSFSSLDGTKHPFRVENCGSTAGNKAEDIQIGPQAFTGEYPEYSWLCYRLFFVTAPLPADQVFKLDIGAIVGAGKTITIPTVTLKPPTP